MATYGEGDGFCKYHALHDIFFLFIYLFVSSLWLLGCIIFWGCRCAPDAMPPCYQHDLGFSPTSEGWQAESTHLVLIRWPDKGLNWRPKDLKSDTLTVKPTPGLFIIVCILKNVITKITLVNSYSFDGLINSTSCGIGWGKFLILSQTGWASLRFDWDHLERNL